MKVIGKIFAGISLGMIVSVLLGTVMLQGALFKRGAELLGVGTVGLTYFVGCFFACLILMFFPGAKQYKRLVGAFGVAVVIVGVTALTGIFQMEAPSGALVNPAAYAGQMVSFLAQLAFWVVPAGVTGFFAYLIWDHQTVVK